MTMRCTKAAMIAPLLIALALALPPGCGKQSSSNEPAPAASAEDAIQRIATGMRENKPVALWHAMPASYQKDFQDIMREAIGKFDAKAWESVVETTRRLRALLKDKKQFIANHPTVAGLLGKENAEKVIDDLLHVLNELLASDLADYSKAKQIDIARFLDTTGAKVMGKLLETLNSLSMLQQSPQYVAMFHKIGQMKATKVSGDGDTVMLKLEVPGAPSREEAFTSIEGKWVLKGMADQWDAEMKRFRAELAAFTDAELKAMNDMIFDRASVFQLVLSPLEKATTQEDFNAAMNKLLAMVIGSNTGEPPAPRPEVRRGPADQYYYDVNAQKLFVAPGNALPPIPAPSDPQKLAFKAYVFSCGDCSNEKERFVGYYEGFKAEFKEAYQRVQDKVQKGKPSQEDLQIIEEGFTKGRLISPDAITWVESDSPEGIAINHELSKKCEGKGRLRPCYPGIDEPSDDRKGPPADRDKKTSGADKVLPPTAFSCDRILKKRDLSHLPGLARIEKGDATAAFASLLKYAEDHRDKIDPEGAPAQVGDDVITLFIKVHDTGSVPGNALDAMVPMEPQARPKFGAALLDLTEVAMRRASDLHRRGKEQDKARAEITALAVWALGQTMFENSERIQMRTMGLELMRAAGTELYNWSGDDTVIGKVIAEWVQGINDFDQDYWGPKSEVVYTLRYGEPHGPTLADLMRMAEKDEDPGWRIAATLELARAKYSKRNAAEDRAMQAMIQKLMSDESAKVAAAAKVANEYTRQNVRDLGK